MPLNANTTLYTGESFWWVLPSVNLNEVLVTAANPPDSFTYIVLLNGSSVATGSMSHVSDQTGTWRAQIAGLATAGEYHLHATATKGASIGKFHDTVVITAFT